MKNPDIKPTRSLMTALLLVAVSSVAWADDPLQVKAWSYYGGSNDWETGSVGPIFDSSSSTGGGGEAYAEGSVDYGIIKLHGEANKISSAHTGQAQAEWNDVLSFDSPGLTGQQGFLTLHYQVDGTFDVGPSGSYTDYARFQLSVSARDTYTNNYYEDNPEFRAQGDGTLDNPNFLNAPRAMNISFTYGQPIELRFWLNVVANAYYQNGSYAVADSSHTATWGGITDVEDSAHNAVTNFSFSSDSGVNYINAIPEPSVADLLIGTSPLIFALTRKKFRKG